MQRELNIDDCSRLNQKIVSEITFLMEEHRVFKRPFILNGIDYLEMLKREMSQSIESENEHQIKISRKVHSDNNQNNTDSMVVIQQD